jgi:tetratricopeptide (TPR) repeat protein
MGLGLTSTQQAQAQAPLEQLFQEAQAAQARGKLAEAAEKYQEVIRRQPRLASAYQNLGIVYFSERKYEKAANTLKNALKLDARLPGAYVVLGMSYYLLAQPKEAVAAFDNALKLNPDDSNALFYRGRAQMQEGDYRAAVATLEELKGLKPDDPDVLYALGVSYLKLLAETRNRLVDVAPHSYQVWLLYAQDAEAHDDYAAAIHAYQKALSTKLDAMGAHYALGSVYAKVGRYEEAAEEMKKELQLNPRDSLALWKLGELALRTNPGEAKGYLQLAVELAPDLPEAVLAYGRALLRTGETEKAVEEFHRVVRLAPEEDTVHYLLANAYRKLGHKAEADRECVRFQELARVKSAQREALARELVTSSDREGKGESLDPEPGFSPSRQPVHP